MHKDEETNMMRFVVVPLCLLHPIAEIRSCIFPINTGKYEFTFLYYCSHAVYLCPHTGINKHFN